MIVISFQEHVNADMPHHGKASVIVIAPIESRNAQITAYENLLPADHYIFGSEIAQNH